MSKTIEGQPRTQPNHMRHNIYHMNSLIFSRIILNEQPLLRNATQIKMTKNKSHNHNHKIERDDINIIQ